MDIAVDLVERVYVKTSKAHEELAGRRYGLRAKARQLLVLIDGSRPLGAFSGMMSAQDLHELVLGLQLQGFITRQVTTLSQQAAQPIQVSPIHTPILVPSSEPALDPVMLTRVKAYLIETSQQHLGLMASKLQREIAEAQDAAGLRAALAHWNMAMRESHSGADVACSCLLQAHEILGWNQ